MSNVKIVKFIKTELLRRGAGKENDPVRIITQYWDMDGNLVFEIDPCIEEKVKYFTKAITN